MKKMIIILLVGGILIGVVASIVIAATSTVRDTRNLNEIRDRVNRLLTRTANNPDADRGDRTEVIQDLMRKAGTIVYTPKRDQAFQLINLIK